MKDIAIYGSGGFGMEVACLINNINNTSPQWNFLGFFDDTKTIGSKNDFGYIIGGINELNNYKKTLSIVISIGNPTSVRKIASSINNDLINFPNLFSPDLVLLDSKSFLIGKGNIFMNQILVSFGVSIGDFNVFNCGASIGHETKIGSYNSFMSYVKLSGNVTIGFENYFGVCSVVLQKNIIGNGTTIGANSVIMRKTKDFATYLGNPATELIKPVINQ